jgi:hypothetical protein
MIVINMILTVITCNDSNKYDTYSNYM